MAKEIVIKIDGMPELVDIVQRGKEQFATVWLESSKPTTTETLAIALTKLNELGFSFYGFTYSEGWYGSVDDKRLEFTKYNK